MGRTVAASFSLVVGLRGPVAADPSPDLPIPGLSFAQVSETRDPVIFESWNTFVKKSHHGVRQIDGSQYLLKRDRQTLSKGLQKEMNAVLPHSHGIAYFEAASGKDGRAWG